MSEYSSQAIWLTQEAYDKLRSELDHLSGPGRAAMAQKIAQAREEGDLRENGGYHAARDEQGGRRRGFVSCPTCSAGRKSAKPRQRLVRLPPARVTIAFDGDVSDTDTFVLGSRELLGLDESIDTTNVYSPQSPLGAAILGKREGDAVVLRCSNGRSINVTVIKVEPF